MGDVTPDGPESAPDTHAGVIIPTPAERETLSPERRAFIRTFNHAVSVTRACTEASTPEPADETR